MNLYVILLEVGEGIWLLAFSFLFTVLMHSRGPPGVEYPETLLLCILAIVDAFENGSINILVFAFLCLGLLVTLISAVYINIE